ncbi:unnamed protein product [Protopolystoma xenopodis]|uniref:Uncharacterized protein n=1 Tax=Protopolystoma xenopodis TaxID=117903 RepID=A0A448XMC1_9PLAT|nr:unnamed protein product [Protopolystoma xenopodis]
MRLLVLRNSFCPEIPQPASSRDGETASWAVQHDHPAAPLTVRLANFGHLTVCQGQCVLEAYYLVNAKRWVWAIQVGESICSKHPLSPAFND